jgi:beta-phosphoglucomutase-like phosphatase (HAD superfamily)
MTRIAVLVEVEGLLFETDDLRARALHTALQTDGIDVPLADLLQLHAGTTSAVALTQLSAADSLDDTARELTVRRAGDSAQQAMYETAPRFLPESRDALLLLAEQFQIGVVTRGALEPIQHLLDSIGLAPYISAIHSLHEIAGTEQHVVWARARQRMHADQCVALAPAAMLDAAARAGLRTVSIGPLRSPGRAAHLAALSDVNASFIISLFTEQ